jgi:hypothetical protein
MYNKNFQIKVAKEYIASGLSFNKFQKTCYSSISDRTISKWVSKYEKGTLESNVRVEKIPTNELEQLDNSVPVTVVCFDIPPEKEEPATVSTNVVNENLDLINKIKFNQDLYKICSLTMDMNFSPTNQTVVNKIMELYL